MKEIKRLFVATLLSLSLGAYAERSISVIPLPSEVNTTEGHFALTSKTTIQSDEKLKPIADLFAKTLRTSTGYKMVFSKNGSIRFSLNSSLLSALGNEGYRIKVSTNNIKVEAASEAGVFYATQTLLQLLPPQAIGSRKSRSTKWNIPCVEISDSPRFKWRGFMMDVSRTFYSIDFLKKYIDVMSLYKINTLHFHLTDDQGWRMEIKKYPLLTSKIATTFHESEHQPAERSGFYTREQLKDLVKYASERFVTIVPEIDVPGHSWATLLVYPELGVNKRRDPEYIFPFCSSWKFWGIQFTPNSLDPTKEEVYTFLDDVMSEVAEIFPSDYIHFGGDEVLHSVWEKEPHIQEFMKEKGMKTTNDLQNYFVERISKIILSKGKKPIGWNDILADAENLTKETAIMAWLGHDAIAKAAGNGFYTVASPTAPLYLDITQNSRNDGTHADLAYGSINTMERVYKYDPTNDIDEKYHKYILGIQANLWTHMAIEIKDVNVQTFPRLIALAEAVWTPEKRKDFDGFQKRLVNSHKILDELKIDYFRPNGYIVNQWTPQTLSTQDAPVEWDVTQMVYANGRVNAGFYYTSGKNYMQISKVELLENGKVISVDEHEGLADTFRGTNKKKSFLYALTVDNYNAKAKYVLRATVKGQNGNDSYGNVTFNLCPYKAFTVTGK